ncbi:hypothetical protein JCM4814A_22640 [Streptomyces phaeofaciens JCM 4814]|uniref:Uncharacterized protein n=1 Tax=Streptomyces phaeofaciens TaxID=68254 RepID=A0A918H3C9_9ACTN|nr:hypothetical protein GCM10010226_07990 [Streptomyces phaeofaciens]
MAALAVPLLLLPLGGCSSGTPETCMPRDTSGISSADLPGTYVGAQDAEGATITLGPSDGSGKGKVTVRDWPTGDWYRSELGDTFDGSGTWGFDPGAGTGGTPRVGLRLTEPKLFLDGDTLDSLSVAADAERTFLYEDDDPDICAKFRLQLEK